MGSSSHFRELIEDGIGHAVVIATRLGCPVTGSNPAEPVAWSETYQFGFTPATRDRRDAAGDNEK